MLTEEEAKRKLCPMVRKILTFGSAGGSPGTQEMMFCIASACMAWRWRVMPAIAKERAEKNRGNVPALWSEDEMVARGYCGLAGNPS